jgi:hypothetical protein
LEIKIIIYYIDFHWDNHQGGSGKSFEMRFVYEAPVNMFLRDLKDRACIALSDHVKNSRPFQQDNQYSIQRMEIL